MSDNKDYMKNLSTFISDRFTKVLIDNLFSESVYVDTMADAENSARLVSAGKINCIVFENSTLKSRFMNSLSILRPNLNIINCNCSIESFKDNNLDDGFLVFNNLKHCHNKDIIEEIKRHKGVIIC